MVVAAALVVGPAKRIPEAMRQGCGECLFSLLISWDFSCTVHLKMRCVGAKSSAPIDAVPCPVSGPYPLSHRIDQPCSFALPMRRRDNRRMLANKESERICVELEIDSSFDVGYLLQPYMHHPCWAIKLVLMRY